MMVPNSLCEEEAERRKACSGKHEFSMGKPNEEKIGKRKQSSGAHK